MREIPGIPAFVVNKQKIPILLGLILSLVALPANVGCIKKRIKAQVSAKILQARTASFDELIDILKRYDQIRDLSSNALRAKLSYGKWESGEVDRYRDAPGYILLRRPGSTHLRIQNFVTKTTVLDILSVGNEFSAWIPSRNKFYQGDNSAKELVSKDLPNGIPFRGTHIFEAIFPQSMQLDAPELLISLEEAVDTEAKYYILSQYKRGSAPRIHAIRKIWIERSELAIARQQIYMEDGRLISDIKYSVLEPVNEFLLPLKINIDRPLDGYALELEFRSRSWRINSNLPDDGFVLKPPEGAEIIQLKEKVQ
jgi:hypothetical protein